MYDRESIIHGRLIDLLVAALQSVQNLNLVLITRDSLSKVSIMATPFTRAHLWIQACSDIS